MAAPLIHCYETGSATAGAATVNKPTSGSTAGPDGAKNAAVDDYIVIIAGNDDTSATDQFGQSNAPTGFTFVNEAGDATSDAHCGAYYRKVDGTEGSSFSVSSVLNEDTWAVAVLISRVALTSPVNVTGGDVIDGVPPIAITQVTTTVNDCLVLSAWCFDGGDDGGFSTSGTGWTELAESRSGTAAGNASGGVSYKKMSGQGATVNCTVTPVVSDGMAGFQFALAPGPTARSGLDGLFMRDNTIKDRAHTERDAPLLGSLRSGELAKLLREFSLLSDSGVREPERGRYGADGLFMRDARTSELSVQLRTSLLLLTKLSEVRESIFVDKLFILSRPLVHDHDLRYLPELVFLLDSVAIQLGELGFNRSVLDGLFMRDERVSDRSSITREAALLASLRTSERLSLQTDRLLTADAALPSAERTRLAVDALLAKDLDYRLREATQRDGVLVSAARYSEVLRALLDLLLVVDSAALERPGIERVVIDGLFLLDARVFAQEHVMRDGLLFADQRVSELTKTLTDKLFISDTADRLLLRERLALDGLLVADSVLRGIELVLRDGLLVVDSADAQKTGAIIRYALDGLLLLDTVQREQGATQREGLLMEDRAFRETLRALRSSLLVADTSAAALERTRLVRDSVLMLDRDTRERLLYLLDLLLIGDSATAQVAGGFVFYDRAAVDYLLLDDRRLSSEIARLLRESVLLSSTSVREKEAVRFIADQLLLGDRRLASELARVLRDGVVLNDRMIKLQEQSHRDTALLGSAALLGKDVVRALADAMLLLDKRSSERSITRLDAMMLHSLATRARELLTREGLLLSDVVSAQWFPIVIEFITYVRLGISQILGVTVRALDPVGIRLRHEDPLGLTLSWSRWRADGA